MSTAQDQSVDELITQYKELHTEFVDRAKANDETWLEDAIEAFLGLEVTQAQREICRSVVNNPKTLVITANGLGKSYILAAITIVWLLVKYPAVSFATSGTEKKMRRTYCKPIENLHRNAPVPLPGTYKSRPERIEFDGNPEHYFEATSPQDAGELEGVHGAYTLAIIEEADKKDVDGEVIDAMDSLITDQQDRTIAIANPPEDESNSVYDLIQDPTWNNVRFSSFDSHNVQVELGHTEGEKIDGLATLYKIKQDWESFNQTEWPGVEEAKNAHIEDSEYYRENLDTRWLRRRIGVMPGEDASVHRPFSVSNVEGGFDPSVTLEGEPTGLSLDVARMGGDSNALGATDGDVVSIVDDWKGVDHNQNEANVKGNMGNLWDATFAIDANGEGSGLADRIANWYPNVHRFDAGGEADEGTEFYDCWAEGLYLLGQFLKDGGSFNDRRLREELLAAARVVEFEEKYYASRDSTVLKATPKSDVKDQLGRSPDYLDAAYMSVWAEEAQASGGNFMATQYY